MKKNHLIGLTLIALSIGVIVSIASDSSSYETFDHAMDNPDEEYYIVGTLAEGKSIEYDPEINANLMSFYMIDKNGEERKVIYHDSKPQDFERSEEIVITGKMKGEVFEAKTMLLKCPSKYTEDGQELKEYKAGEGESGVNSY